MKITGNLIAVLILNILIAGSAFSQVSPKIEIEKIRESIAQTHRDIDWNTYDATSKVLIDSININMLQGVWKAYDGIFKFNGSVNSMALTTPLVIEFAEDKYRTNLKGAFKRFALAKNHIKAKEENWDGYINSISDSILVITWGDGDNKSRYYYQK